MTLNRRGMLTMFFGFCEEWTTGMKGSLKIAWERGLAPARTAKWAALMMLGLAIAGSAATRPDWPASAALDGERIRKVATPTAEDRKSADWPNVARGRFHVNHTGRLPVSLQGFKLGMPVREAIALFNSPEAPKDELQAVFASYPMTNRILVNIQPYQGRVIQITASAENLSPDYADYFESKVFAQLGRPDAEIYEENMLVPTRRYIWIDQDVRIAYEHMVGSAGENTLRVTLVAYPVSLASLEGVPSLTDAAEKEWGAKPKPNPYAPGIASASARFEKEPGQTGDHTPHYQLAPATNGSFFLATDFDNGQTR